MCRIGGRKSWASGTQVFGHGGAVVTSHYLPADHVLQFGDGSHGLDGRRDGENGEALPGRLEHGLHAGQDTSDVRRN